MTALALVSGQLKKYLAHLAALSRTIDAAYVLTKDHKDRVRAEEVTRLVAADRDVAVSTPLRQDVRKAARLLGFTRVIRRDNVAQYTRMKRRG